MGSRYCIKIYQDENRKTHQDKVTVKEGIQYWDIRDQVSYRLGITSIYFLKNHYFHILKIIPPPQKLTSLLD